MFSIKCVPDVLLVTNELKFKKAMYYISQSELPEIKDLKDPESNPYYWTKDGYELLYKALPLLESCSDAYPEAKYYLGLCYAHYIMPDYLATWMSHANVRTSNTLKYSENLLLVYPLIFLQEAYNKGYLNAKPLLDAMLEKQEQYKKRWYTNTKKKVDEFLKSYNEYMGQHPANINDI